MEGPALLGWFNPIRAQLLTLTTPGMPKLLAEHLGYFGFFGGAARWWRRKRLEDTFTVVDMLSSENSWPAPLRYMTSGFRVGMQQPDFNEIWAQNTWFLSALNSLREKDLTHRNEAPCGCAEQAVLLACSNCGWWSKWSWLGATGSYSTSAIINY